jgi:HSP20 family protein
MLARMINDSGFGLGNAPGNGWGGTFAPLLRLHGEMDRMFEDFFEGAPASRRYGAAYPALNTWEDGDAAYVEAELPGLGMEDIEVLVSGNGVTINGERKIEAAGGANWHRRERGQGRFSRAVTLPGEIDADKVDAKLQDGVLTVRLPRSESHRPKKVKVLTE